MQHTIPGVGLRDIKLFPPADAVYRYLEESGEIDRLRRLKHTGAIERALPGIPHSRYDYIASMLFATSCLQLPGIKRRATFGDVKFSSRAAAIQILALLSNIGHLPGTFAVEKGIWQWMAEWHRNSPTEVLPWISEYFEDSFADKLRQDMDDYLWEWDYGGLNRVLTIEKMCRKLLEKPCPLMHKVLVGFFVPFLISERRDEKQEVTWGSVDRHYQTVRHVSYLNLDAAFADVPVQVDVAGLLEKVAGDAQGTKTHLEQAHEVLGAYEHSVYERLYHRPESRKVTGLVARLVREKLTESSQPEELVGRWLDEADMREVIREEDLDLADRRFKKVASVSVRTPYLNVEFSPADNEYKLRKKISDSEALTNILVYEPWERRHHDEPPHTYVDVFATGPQTPDRVGRVISWFSNTDRSEVSLTKHPDTYDLIRLLRKRDFGEVYTSLFEEAALLAWGKTLSLQPWPLAKMGVGARDTPSVAAWRANWDLSDSHIKSLLRRQQRNTSKHLEATLTELHGLADLRSQLLKQDRDRVGPGKRLRQTHLVLTSSIRLQGEDGNIDAEFDGGILRISSHSGRLTLYALETKSAKSAKGARNALNNKLQKLGLLSGSVCTLGRRSAYWEIPLITGKAL